MNSSDESLPLGSAGQPPLYRVILAASIGNTLEWFDFLIYGYFAVTIAKLFFPTGNETVSLLLTLGTFGARKAIALTEVDHLELFTLASARPYGVLLFVDRAGRSVLRLNTADLLPSPGLAELSRLSGLSIRGSWAERLSLGQMARRFPGSVRSSELAVNALAAHPTRTASITAVVTVLFFVVLFAALVSRSGR